MYFCQIYIKNLNLLRLKINLLYTDNIKVYSF